MSPRLRNILLSVVALAMLAAAARAFLPAKSAPAPSPAAARKAPATLEFLPREIVTTEPLELRQVLELSGSLRAVEMAAVKARVGGEVRTVLVREGEPVKAGQVVVRMDATEYEARVAQARGNLDSARAQLEIAGKTRDNNLVLVEKGFISKNAFDNSASQYAGAKASVAAAQGALDIALKSLNDTVLRAPISGTVSARSVQPGEKVATDNKLLEIVNLQTMELEAAVPASDIARVSVGQTVALRVEGMPQRFSGKVTRINPATQSGTRSVPVYIQVANPGQQLRAGMFAEAQLVLASRSGVLALPPSALRRDEDGDFVLALADGKVARRPVTTGISGIAGDEQRVEIASGLAFGEQIIRTDMGKLQPGTPARVQPVAAAAQ